MTRAQSKTSPKRRDTGIWLIAWFKLAKGLLLLAIGLGVAALLHQNVAATLTHWARVLWIARENRYVQTLLYKAAGLDHRALRITETGTLVYSALLLTEGAGLLLRKLWAEYLTVIITASFIPFEIFSMTSRFSIPRLIVLIINAVVVGYLCRTLWRERGALKAGFDNRGL